MGTKFIATSESMADPRYKEMLVASSADDILLTTAFTGLQTNMLRPSISAAGLDPDDLPARGAIDVGKDIDIGARDPATPEASPGSDGQSAEASAKAGNRQKRWRDIWSAGHSTSGVDAVLPVDELVARTAREYREACNQIVLAITYHNWYVCLVL
jgi:nitronate monooxygenase